MKIQIAQFAGELPKSIPRLLPDNYAQLSINSKMEDGSLTPIRQGRLVKHLAADADTIYRVGEEWLSWPSAVDVVQGPVATDRLYVTGNGAPKIMRAGVSLPLALKGPKNAPVVQLAGSPGTDVSSTVLYCYTWVTDMDEESEPSPASASILKDPIMSVILKFSEQPPAGRAVNRMRIYRSQTSALGDTTFYFIMERPFSLNDAFDTALPIVEPLPSLDYNPPPDTLAGIISLPNGMMAAFSGKDLHFCEPYLPHAWPEKYVLTTDYEIVGLGAFGSSLVVTTKGTPYIVTGSAPENMTMEKLELNLPCINKRGIVDLGYSIAYPSHAGLVVVSTDGASVVTGALMSRDQWLQMNPYSFVSSQFSGRYLASYAYQDANGTAQRGIIIIDLTGQPFITRSSDYADTMYHEIETGSLYVLKDGRDIYEWDAPSQPFGEQTWLSKRFVLQTDTNFGAILIEGEDLTTPAQRVAQAEKNAAMRIQNRELIASGKFGGNLSSAELGTLPIAASLLNEIDETVSAVGVTIIADGREVGYVSQLNQIARLPSGFLARNWEIAVRGNIAISGIILASTPTDIAEG